MKIYTKRDLLKALKKANLPYSYKTLLQYEKAGLLDRGGNEIVSRSSTRFYTEQEIAEIVQKVKNYKAPISQ